MCMINEKLLLQFLSLFFGIYCFYMWWCVAFSFWFLFSLKVCVHSHDASFWIFVDIRYALTTFIEYSRRNDMFCVLWIQWCCVVYIVVEVVVHITVLRTCEILDSTHYIRQFIVIKGGMGDNKPPIFWLHPSSVISAWHPSTPGSEVSRNDGLLYQIHNLSIYHDPEPLRLPSTGCHKPGAADVQKACDAHSIINMHISLFFPIYVVWLWGIRTTNLGNN